MTNHTTPAAEPTSTSDEPSHDACFASIASIDSHESLATQSALDRRIRQLIPCAFQRQLWLLLLDRDDVQMPVMIPIGDLPVRPDGPFGERLGGERPGGERPGGSRSGGKRSRGKGPGGTKNHGAADVGHDPTEADGEGLPELLRTLDTEFGAGSYVFVMERPGDAVLDDADACWLRCLLSAADGISANVRAVYLSYGLGQVAFTRDDLGTVEAGLELPSTDPACLVCPRGQSESGLADERSFAAAW